MLKLIFNNIDKRRVQAITTLLTVALSVAVLFALLLLYTGVSNGVETSEQRMGADIVVIPEEVESMMSETDLLFTGAPVTAYMKKEKADEIAKINGVKSVTVQFYGQTLNASCCSSTAEQRVIGYDSGSDWIISPWADRNIEGRLADDEVVLGSEVGGFNGGSGRLLGHEVKVAAVLEPSGTSLDTSVLVDIDTARKFSAKMEGYEHYWEKYGQPDMLISAVMVKTDPDKKTSVANLIEMKGDLTCIKSSDVLSEIQDKMQIIFGLMLGAGILFFITMVLQLMARFYSMAWERKTELGFYRAMGASERDLKLLISGEAAILTGLGAVAGLALGAGMYALLLSILMNDDVFPFLAPSALMVAVGAVVMLLFAVLTGMLSVMAPLQQIKKIEPSLAMQKSDID